MTREQDESEIFLAMVGLFLILSAAGLYLLRAFLRVPVNQDGGI